MGMIADRIAAISEIARCFTMGTAIAGCLSLAALQASAQTPETAPAPKPAAPATFSGCVQKAPGSNTTLVIGSATACARLTGKVSVEDIAGHEVELKGIMTPRSASTAASIEVDSVVSVGKSCTDVCALRPPGTRGLHPPKDGAVPGSEGGTPGAAAPPP